MDNLELDNVDINETETEDVYPEKESYKAWPFKADDWVINKILSMPEIMFRVLTIKNYKISQLSTLIYDIYSEIEQIREKMEDADDAFQKKKAYLAKAEKDGNKNIQIPLEGEYSLKKYVTLYKLYEVVSWFSKLRGEKTLFKLCVIEKQKLIEKMMPIADLSIRKVIGAKVINRKSDLFEDAVSNAWVSIINFMPKIDPSRVMFSLFVSIAHKSAYFFNARHLKHVYNSVQLSVLEDKMNQANDEIDSEFFLSSVTNKNEGIGQTSFEEEILDRIDLEEEASNLNLDSFEDIDVDELVKQITIDDEDILTRNIEGNRRSFIEQRILAFSFTLLSGKVRKLCYQKIYAEFFIDLINQEISRKIIGKYADLFLNVINFDELSSINKDDEEISDTIVKMLKLWIKEKIERKFKNSSTKVNKDSQLVERESSVLAYLKENNKIALKELIDFRKDCLIFKI